MNRNEHIKDLTKVIPKEIRLAVYKEAIEIIEKGEKVFNMDAFSLCILLPCILWNLETYMKDAPSGIDWDFEDVVIAFPELTNKKIYKIQYAGIESLKDSIRLKYLKEFVNQLSNE